MLSEIALQLPSIQTLRDGRQTDHGHPRSRVPESRFTKNLNTSVRVQRKWHVDSLHHELHSTLLAGFLAVFQSFDSAPKSHSSFAATAIDCARPSHREDLAISAARSSAITRTSMSSSSMALFA